MAMWRFILCSVAAAVTVSAGTLAPDYLANNINTDTLDDSDLLDVVKNFISEQDPILELYISLCFLHPQCYQLDTPVVLEGGAPPPDLSLFQSKELWGHLKTRRTESARNLLVGLIRQIQRENKRMMFKYIQEGVGERGVSVAATKNIIDSIKSVWQTVNRDLEAVKSSVEELFYLLPIQTESQRIAMVDLVGALLAIPGHTAKLYQEAASLGYQKYVEEDSWNSWKKTQ